ncbi:MAG: TetR/AcrR family transcriptional regulator [Lachnospiraceae bacterium]|nr:TetR/AcrR family transcriptional regulator [Lachnospiraceae bacterium]
MPKVSEDYMQNKRKLIVQKAYDLCLEKTVSTVTMQDIIDAAELSQGGIYRFYKNIDEIFRDMLIDNRQRVTIKDKVDDIFAKEEDTEVRVILHELFDLLADFMTKELMGIVKINFELSVLSMNEPQRVEKILGSIEGTGNFEYLFQKTVSYLNKHIASGHLSPKIKTEEIITYLTSSYNGIEMSCIINHCYKKLPLMEWYVPKTQLKTLETTLYYLLGLED